MSSVFFARRRVLTSALSVSLLLYALAVPASAAIATPTDLVPIGSTSDHTPTLGWTNPSGSVKSEVQVDDDVDFSSPLFSATTTNNRVVPDKVLPSGEISWRVRALDSGGTASGWASESFVISALGAPTPKSPINGAALAQPDHPPLFTWTAVPGAVKYTVQVDETDEFTTPNSTTDTQATSLVSPNPLAVGTYYWRVKASLATGIDSVYSDAEQFAVSALAAVTNLDPTNGAEQQDVVLSWQAVRGASYYEVEVATDAGFNTKLSGIPTKIYGTRFSPAETFDNDQYFWRVRAVDTAGNKTPWPAVAEFNRIWGDPDRPTAVYPLGTTAEPFSLGSEAAGDDVYFQWTPVHHASHYELQVGPDANFSPGTYDHCEIAGTTYTAGNFRINSETGQILTRGDDGCFPAPGAVSYWRVRAIDLPATSPTVESLFSDPQALRNDGRAFTGLSPANGATVDVPTLAWDPVPGAKEYKVVIKNANGLSVKSVTTAATSYTPVAVSALDPSKGPFTWRITAYDDAGRALTVTIERTFGVSGNDPASSGEAPLTPLTDDGATARAPQLRWEADPDADHYRLFVRSHGSSAWLTSASDDALDKKLPYPAVTDTSTRLLGVGDYDWQVRSYAANGTQRAEGPVGTFTITEFEAVTGGRIALGGQALDDDDACALAVPDTCPNVPATPVLDWDPVPDAAFYMVYLSQDENFTNLVEPRTALGATSSTRFTPTFDAVKSALADNNTDKPYWWVIRPCRAVTSCGPNPESVSDLATNKFQKTSAPVTLLTPADNATVGTADVQLDWQDYLTTNQNAAAWQTDQKSPQAARAYRVQVDDDASFASPIETAVVDQSTYTSAAKLYPEGRLYWRVQAIDADENGLTWSSPRSFEKKTSAIEPTGPINGASVGGSPAFRWTSPAFVGSYQVEVYTQNCNAPSTANKVFSVTGLKQPSYVWTKPIPASTQAYEWRVRRMDPLGNAGPWSDCATFKSSGDVPTLTSPDASSFQPSAGTLFTWSAVRDATTYTLETRNATSDKRVSGTPKTTPATGWAPLAAVAEGTWEWRVTAKDSAGGAIGTSGWRSFTIDATRPTVTAKAPLTTAATSANFTAKFSEPVKNVSTSTMVIFKSGSTTPLPASVSWDAAKRKATLNPSSDLKRGRTYVVKLSKSITDLAGNRLVSTSWTVTVS